MNVQGIIFDYDGTLVDTEESHFLAWQKTLQTYGRHFALEEYLSLYAGQTGDTIAKSFGEELKCDPNELFKIKSGYFRSIQVAAILPTIDFIRRLTKIKTLKLAIASASPKSEILHGLTQIGIAHLFNLVVSGVEDLVSYTDPKGVNKPKPYIYQETLQRLEIDASSCVAIEDSHIGVEAARSSGCFTLAVPNRYTQHHNFSQANLILPTFAGLSPNSFFKIIEKNI